MYFMMFASQIAVTHPNNAASQCVLTKLGFAPAGHTASSDGQMLVLRPRCRYERVSEL